MARGLIGLCAAALIVAGLASCSARAGDGKPQVVVALYPYAYVAQRIGGRAVDVTDLTLPGVEPHDLELTPQQIAQVAGADVIVYESGFQPAVDQAVAQSSARHVLDVTKVVRLRRTAGSGQSLDPHVWLDPVRLATVARAVLRELVAADPAQARSFRSNAALLASNLGALDHAYRQGLAHCTRRLFVTSHAAFGYLARRYGLRMVAIDGLDPAAEPSPQRQAQIVDLVRRSGVSTIFTEPLVSSAVADSIAAETGARVAPLDPIEGLSAATRGQTYLTLMRTNLAALRRADGCR